MPNDEIIISFNEKTIPMIEMIQHAIDENSELARLSEKALFYAGFSEYKAT